MGRSKQPAPKRRRIQEEEAEQQALQTLLATHTDQVEAAAAEATRARIQHWPQLQLARTTTASTITNEDGNSCRVYDPQPPPEEEKESWLAGLGVATTVPSHHFQALRCLHEQIKEQVTSTSPTSTSSSANQQQVVSTGGASWSSWSGSPDDPRRRAFGILPHTLGCRDDVQDRLDISTPWKNNDEQDDERSRNHKAIVVLDTLPKGCREAIDWLCETLGDFIVEEESPPNNNNKGDDDDHHQQQQQQQQQQPQQQQERQALPLIRDYLQYDHLIAAQPNLHCGRDLLPIHVDHPLKDGFGVIIVTIGMVGSGTLLLQSNHTNESQQKRTTMRVEEGQAYLLSGMARNACAHGVLATASEGGKRESLNLRFGLHDFDFGLGASSSSSSISDTTAGAKEVDKNEPRSCRLLPVVPSSDVLQYWELP